MTKTEFLDVIFEFFSKNDDNLKRQYFDAFITNKKINWDNLYQYVIKNVETRYLPAPSYFIKLFPKFEIRTFEQTKLDGYQIRVYFKSGRFNDFTICKCGVTLNNIVDRFKGNDDVIRAKLYEPHVTLMVNHIYPENAEAKLIYSI